MNVVNGSATLPPLAAVTQSPPCVRVVAPGNESGLRPPALVAVDIEEGEEVDWIWTHLPDGRSVVTGFRIRLRASGISSWREKGRSQHG